MSKNQNNRDSEGQKRAKWICDQLVALVVRFTNNVAVRPDFCYREVSPKKARHGKEAAMPGPTPARCTFPDRFLQEARDTIRRRTAAVQDVQRCRLVLLLHQKPDLRNEVAAAAVGLSSRQVQRWRSRWADSDYSIEDQPGRGRKPAFSPSRSSPDSRPRV